MRTAEQRPTQDLSLKANFSWTFVGNLIYAACQWLSLTVFARLGTTEMVGQFALGLAVVTPVIMFTNLQLRDLQATDAKNEYQFADYFCLRLATTALGLLVVLGITVGLRYRPETALVILAVGIAKAFEAISETFHGLFQRHERMDFVSKSMIMRGLLSPIAVAIGMYLTGQVLWGVICMALAWGLVLVTYDFRTGRALLHNIMLQNPLLPQGQQNNLALFLKPNPKSMSRLIILAVPLAFSILIGALNNNIPRYFIEQNLNEHNLGIFAAIAYIPVAGVTVANALARSALPRMAKYYTTNNRAGFFGLIVKLLGLGLLLGVAGVLVSIIAGYSILLICYGPEYALHTDTLVLQMIAGGLIYLTWFLGSGMTAARQLRVQVFTLGLAFVINIGACFWLVPTRGLVGASLAQVLSSGVQVLISLFVMLHIYRTFLATKKAEVL